MPSRDDLYILPDSSGLVKHFFEVLLTIPKQLLFVISGLPQRLLYYKLYLFTLSREFYKEIGIPCFILIECCINFRLYKGYYAVRHLILQLFFFILVNSCII